MNFTSKITESSELKLKLLKDVGVIEEICEKLTNCFKQNKTVFVAGNGGSAADAQHMAGELVGRFKLERKGLPCIALTTDTSVITACGNDYDFDSIFERQIEALGRKGDVFIGISTSGNSKNIIRAVEKALEIGLDVVLLLGKNGGKLMKMSNYSIVISSEETPRIQECHILIIHLLCEYIENKLFF